MNPNRRVFVSSLGRTLLGAGAIGAGLGAAIRGARAQSQPPSIRAAQGAPLIGWITIGTRLGRTDAFRTGMRELGYLEGKTYRIEAREVELSPAAIGSATENLVGLGSRLIVAVAVVAPHVVRAAAGRVPTLFAFSGDPVEAGLVRSFARPGGKATGMSFLALELVGKRMELLREILPGTRRVGILANPQHPGQKSELRASAAAAGGLGLATEYFEVRGPGDFDATFAAIAHSKVDGVVVFPESLMTRMSTRISEFGIRERIPLVSSWGLFARDGSLASYGPDVDAGFRRLATFADRLLKGAPPETLPVELPTKVELVVNLRTASAIGVGIPQSVLLRADEVIR